MALVFKVIFFSTSFFFSIIAFGASCNLQSEVTLLNLVNPKISKFINPVSVLWRLEDKTLWVDFEVRVPVQSQKTTYQPNKDYPFQYDVVEVFLAVGDPAAANFDYYEFEVTPNNHSYNVKISVLGGKKNFVDNVSLGAQAQGGASAKSWSGSFKIPLENLDWKGNVNWLRGNFYAIIGRKPNKTYWSTFLPRQQKVNFHAPEFFEPLFDCP